MEEKSKKKRRHLMLVFYWVKKRVPDKKLCPTSANSYISPSTCQEPHVSPYFTRSKAKPPHPRRSTRYKVPPQEKTTIYSVPSKSLLVRRKTYRRYKQRRPKKANTEVRKCKEAENVKREKWGTLGTEVQTSCWVIVWSWFTGKRERNVLSLSFVAVEFACLFLFLPRAETGHH